MRRALLSCCLGLGLGFAARPAWAQPVPEVMDIPETARVGPVPAQPGTGVAVESVRGFFQGHPFSLDDARDMIEGRSIVPIFDVWCGLVPYVNFGNATVPDSLGNRGDPMLCLPFLQAERPDAGVDCRQLPHLPNGAYWMNGGAVLRLRGLLAVRAAGTVTLAWGHDDGFSFALAGTTVSEFPGPTGSRIDRAVVRFAAPGVYPFRLDWFDGVGGALLDWYIADGAHPEGDFTASTFRLVPSADLYPDETAPCRADCAQCPSDSPRCDRTPGRPGRCVACLDASHCTGGAVCTDGRCVVPPTVDAGAPATDVPSDVVADAGAAPGPETGCACRAAHGVQGRGAWHLALGLWWAALRSSRRRRRDAIRSEGATA